MPSYIFKAGQLNNAKLDMVLGNDITTSVAVNELVLIWKKKQRQLKGQYQII